VLGDAAAAEDLLPATVRSATPDHSGLAGCARASRRIPSTQVSTVASGVFISCEKPEAS
jgi:hypothetical protein